MAQPTTSLDILSAHDNNWSRWQVALHDSNCPHRRRVLGQEQRDLVIASFLARTHGCLAALAARGNQRGDNDGNAQHSHPEYGGVPAGSCQWRRT
eukprot:COSAG06_NODE_16711_length_985_cov_1.436795_1_plen_95_part_00